jgi:hypothetical protein
MFSISSSASLPLSKASIAGSLGNIVGKDKVEKTLLFPITEMSSFEIGLLKEENGPQGAAVLGTIALNVIGMFTNTEVPYPYHHFLIAVAKDSSIVANELKNGFEKTNEYLEKEGEELKKIADSPNASFAEKSEARMMMSFSPLKYLFYNIMNNLKTSIVNDGTVYYLIEKGGDKNAIKTIKPFKNIYDIFKEMKSVYHNNKITPIKTYKVKKKLTIEDIHKYISTLPNSYNAIDDNCQHFVSNIIEHYNSYFE